jgi:hypothetical protein
MPGFFSVTYPQLERKWIAEIRHQVGGRGLFTCPKTFHRSSMQDRCILCLQVMRSDNVKITFLKETAEAGCISDVNAVQVPLHGIRQRIHNAWNDRLVRDIDPESFENEAGVLDQRVCQASYLLDRRCNLHDEIIGRDRVVPRQRAILAFQDENVIIPRHDGVVLILFALMLELECLGGVSLILKKTKGLGFCVLVVRPRYRLRTVSVGPDRNSAILGRIGVVIRLRSGSVVGRTSLGWTYEATLGR